MSGRQPTTLVTGATGLVGNNIARALLERGQAVRVLTRRSSDKRPFSGLDVDVVYGDTRDAESVREAVRGVDRVIHSAAAVHIGRTGGDRIRAINVGGTRNVALAAAEAGVRMVHVSSTDAVGITSLDVPADEDTPFDTRITTPYIVTKHEAEEVIRGAVAKDLDAVIVNPSFMLGPWDWRPSSGQMLLSVARGHGRLAPAGHFSAVDVRDVTAAILTAAERGQRGRRYILAGQTLSYLEAFRLFAEVTGARQPWRQLRPLGAKLVGWFGDLCYLLTRREPGFNSAALAVANLPRNYSSARARAELDYTTRPLVQTVAETWNWFQEYGYARPRKSARRRLANQATR